MEKSVTIGRKTYYVSVNDKIEACEYVNTLAGYSNGYETSFIIKPNEKSRK